MERGDAQSACSFHQCVGRRSRDAGKLDTAAQDGAGARDAGVHRAGLRQAGCYEWRGGRGTGREPPDSGDLAQAFAECGPDGLLDEPWPGAPRRITDEQMERAVVTTLESTPPNATRWSTRSLAHAVGLSQSAVVRIWHAFALQPHCGETVKLSRDPLFVDKVRDIVGLYVAPLDRVLVLCVDEKPSIQVTERTAPMRPGQVERQTHDYVRHGTADLFTALNVKSGTVIGVCRQRHRAMESAPSSTRSSAACRPTWTCISCSTTPPPTRAQEPDYPALVGQAPALPPALHLDLRIVAQPRRELVRAADCAPTPPWLVPQHLRPAASNPLLHREQ